MFAGILWPFRIPDPSAPGGILSHLTETVYWHGAKDGAIGAAVILIVLYLVTSQMKTMRIAGMTALIGVLLWLAQNRHPTPPPTPPAPTPTPAPLNPPKPKPPKRPRCPNCPHENVAASVEAKVGGDAAPDGTPIQIDLPENLHLKNRGGADGAGLCVFASCSHAGIWQNEAVFAGLFRYMADKPGGGYPDKVQQMVQRASSEQGLPEPAFIQYEGADLEILKLACKTGRMPGVTYGFSPSGRYGGQHIAHMVSLVHATDQWFAILDNNYPKTIEWMSPDEFKRTFTGGRNGWAVILTERAGPPPEPRSSCQLSVVSCQSSDQQAKAIPIGMSNEIRVAWPRPCVAMSATSNTLRLPLEAKESASSPFIHGHAKPWPCHPAHSSSQLPVVSCQSSDQQANGDRCSYEDFAEPIFSDNRQLATNNCSYEDLAEPIFSDNRQLTTGNYAYEWVRGKDRCQVQLCLDGRQIGTYRFDTHAYHPFDGQSWGPPTKAPVAPPSPPICDCGDDRLCVEKCACQAGPASHSPKKDGAAGQEAKNFGVELKRLHDGERYHVNGRPASKAQALQALQTTVPDDSCCLRLTIIGADADRRRVLADLAAQPALAAYKDRLVVQDYPPDHWAVQCGFKTDGRPTIYVQKPDGVVLHRQDDYDGPEGLALALRKIDPNYDAAKDPDQRRSTPTLDLSQLPPGVWFVVGVVLTLVLKK